MSRLLAVFLILLVPTMVGAVPVWPPMDTPTFVAKTTDILIARCINPDVLGGGKTDGLTLVEVEVLVVVKGDRKAGKTRLGTTGQPMEAGNRYLMASFGGKWGDTDFVAQSDQAVVEMPADFDLKSLAGKTAVQQVQAIFDARRAQVERLLQRLQREKKTLDHTVPKPSANRGLDSPSLRPDDITRDAEATYAAYGRACRAGTEKASDKIPAAYWGDRIKALNPIKVYTHRVNLVVVQRDSDGTEEGKYLYIPISSYLPQTGDEGFMFSPNPRSGNTYTLGNGVFDFKRTRNK